MGSVIFRPGVVAHVSPCTLGGWSRKIASWALPGQRGDSAILSQDRVRRGDVGQCRGSGFTPRYKGKNNRNGMTMFYPLLVMDFHSHSRQFSLHLGFGGGYTKKTALPSARWKTWHFWLQFGLQCVMRVLLLPSKKPWMSATELALPRETSRQNLDSSSKKLRIGKDTFQGLGI